MEKRPTLRFLAGREDAGSTPDPAAPKFNYYLLEYLLNQNCKSERFTIFTFFNLCALP